MQPNQQENNISFRFISIKKVFHFLLLITLMNYLASCTTPIGMINKKPEKYNGKKVKVSGKVVSSLQLKDIKCFTLKERGEKICIITSNYLPLVEANIFVKGIVQKNFQYDGRNLLVIKENSKKTKKIKLWKRISKASINK